MAGLDFRLIPADFSEKNIILLIFVLLHAYNEFFSKKSILFNNNFTLLGDVATKFFETPKPLMLVSLLREKAHIAIYFRQSTLCCWLQL